MQQMGRHGPQCDCKPRGPSKRLWEGVYKFYSYGAEVRECPTDGYRGPDIDIAHLDDNPMHSYLFNLVPLHNRYNRSLGGQKNITKPVKPCFPGLTWDALLLRAKWHHHVGSSRRAYACVRIGYYLQWFYYLYNPRENTESLTCLYEAIAECMYYARHVWNEEILWGLLSHDLSWLLSRDSARLSREVVARVVRGLAALWTEIREPENARAIYEELDRLLGARGGGAVNQKEQCSLLRRLGMASVAREGQKGLIAGGRYAREAATLARTPEERVNAGEVLPWISADRGEWKAVRDGMERLYVEEVQKPLQAFVSDLGQNRNRGTIGSNLLKVPPELTLLNAAQVPMDLGLAIFKTEGRTRTALKRVRRLAELARCAYHLTETRPFAMTDRVRRAYLELAEALNEPWYTHLSEGRMLTTRTVKVLMKAERLALRRLEDAIP